VEQQAYRLNEAVLNCGVVLLERYQALKRQKQQMDFSDLEWQLCRLLQQSEHAETMQYKLDSRYRHVLLDEFQDTNPLQWQILRAWFDAAVAVESQPTVFVVGDPKQSIYRFRRAEARLFGVARDFLKEHFAAHDLHNNHTRRNAPAILDAVNAVFADHPEGFVDFEAHTAEHTDLPGHVEVLPLARGQTAKDAGQKQDAVELSLRDPLTTKREERVEGARQREAVQFGDLLKSIVSNWYVTVDGTRRRATYGDIMVLVRSRTHLEVYEEALRSRHIPFISSRRGGLLDTLEAEDVQALLMFLITPFADLALAQVLRTPIFACSDADLMCLAQTPPLALPLSGDGNQSGGATSTPSPDKGRAGEGFSWWQRLQYLAEPSPALKRAISLLKNWLALADKLPVHDLLDRIYFEGDVLARYTAVLPSEMRAKVAANLHAFMEIALSVDAGRYPSLPRFLQELRELRNSRDEAPDEGKLGVAGNAVRIYTVHESKGLEAPVVWLLDANAERRNREGNDVLLDWPTHEPQPQHFSFYANQASRGKKRAPLFAQDAAQQAREEMNLLYVAMTRARQALIVSGNNNGADEEEPRKAPSWYDRIAAVVNKQPNPLYSSSPLPLAGEGLGRWGNNIEAKLPAITPTGKRASRGTEQQQRGIWLHALLQHLTANSTLPLAGKGPGEKVELQNRLTIPAEEIESLWQRALQLLASPQLARFFDAREYRSACNEMPYVNANGELKRIDRLVEFDEEVWVLDYKLGESEDVLRYRAQMVEYRTAMQAIYTGKKVRCALVFGDKVLSEVL
jgi:ATP-dependent helicase/nuclease subunit A